MILIIIQDTLYAAGRLSAIENHTLWFVIFLKVPVAVLLIMLLTVKVSTLTTTCDYTFSLHCRILIQEYKTYPLIFIVGTNNFLEYLPRYQILRFIYYKFNSIIFTIIQYTVYL